MDENHQPSLHTRTLITALLMSLGSNGSFMLLGSRGQDRMVEQLDRIAETLAATKAEVAAIAAGFAAQLAEHARRLDKLEGSRR